MRRSRSRLAVGPQSGARHLARHGVVLSSHRRHAREFLDDLAASVRAANGLAEEELRSDFARGIAASHRLGQQQPAGGQHHLRRRLRRQLRDGAAAVVRAENSGDLLCLVAKRAGWPAFSARHRCWRPFGSQHARRDSGLGRRRRRDRLPHAASYQLGSDSAIRKCCTKR